MMMLLSGLVTFLAAFLLSWKLTGFMIEFVTERNIIDHPNIRSLHDGPVPRGGGISIVALVVLCITTLWITGDLSNTVFISLIGGGILVFITGFADDVKSVPVTAKGLCYLAAAIWTVYWLNHEGVTLSGPGLFVLALSAFAVAWLINLYNFMDGSDGLAGLQAVFTGIPICVFSFQAGNDWMFYLMLVTVAASGGFLLFNRPPARIFMGDAGSCFLGFMFGACAFYSYVNDEIPLTLWLILLSVFICDASLTLAVRMVRGKKWYEAHREHAYQRTVLMKGSHHSLLYYFIVLYIFLILPLSILVFYLDKFHGTAVIFCYIFLMAVWFFIQYRYKKYSKVSGHV